MRPTYLQFRSPKEQTGEYLSPGLMNNGKALNYGIKQFAKTTFPKGQRWEHIREIACRTSYKVGPGCYNAPSSTNKGKTTKIMRDTATASNIWDYEYVGNSLVKKDRPLSRGTSMSVLRSTTYNTDTSPIHSRGLSPSGSRRNFSPANPRRVYEEESNFVDMTEKGARARPMSAGKRIFDPNNHLNSNGRQTPVVIHREGQVVGNMGFTQRPEASHSAKNVHEVKDRDFYDLLNEQTAPQKIVIHNSVSGKRGFVRSASVTNKRFY